MGGIDHDGTRSAPPQAAWKIEFVIGRWIRDEMQVESYGVGRRLTSSTEGGLTRARKSNVEDPMNQVA